MKHNINYILSVCIGIALTMGLRFVIFSMK